MTVLEVSVAHWKSTPRLEKPPGRDVGLDPGQALPVPEAAGSTRNQQPLLMELLLSGAFHCRLLIKRRRKNKSRQKHTFSDPDIVKRKSYESDIAQYTVCVNFIEHSHS